MLLFCGTAACAAVVAAILFTSDHNQISYSQYDAMPDVELRLKPVGDEVVVKHIDISAYSEFNREYVHAVSCYVESITATVIPSHLTRKRYYHEPRGRSTETSQYPDDANPKYDRDVAVKIKLFPRPEFVRRWLATRSARRGGWRAGEKTIDNRGTVFGRTLVFRAGRLSRNPDSIPASPFGATIPSWDVYAAGYFSQYFLKLGKVVVTPSYDRNGSTLTDETACLELGEPHGATLLGEIITTPLHWKNRCLHWVSIQRDTKQRRFLAYSLLDGNGAMRAKKYQDTKVGPISPYVRPLICKQYQPRILQHDELLLPSPIGWPPTRRDSKCCSAAHEEWCLDEWFPAQKDACWVVREAEDSKPLQESFLLMSASEKSDRPVFMIALFAETEPRRLVTELAALHKVSPDPVLNSPETMERLNSLYQKVRDFPLDK